MAPRRRYPVGVQDFEKLRTDGFVYVDKTGYIYDLANNYGDAIFLGRPRRFGKSLLCSTLKYYFLGRKDLFEGLAIDSLEKDWTQFPVLHFDMSLCKKDNVAEVEEALDSQLRDFEKRLDCLGQESNFGDRLKRLILTAHERTGQRAVLIFDEYDSPVLNVIDSQEKVDAIRSIFNSFYAPVKALGEHIRFLFITGVTKFSQMSIFSTINHLYNISMFEQWEGLCGITAQELEKNFEVDIAMMAQKFRITPQEMMQRLRDRYDGYHFGPGMVDVYNPFSIVNAFASNMLRDYWFSSGTPAALIKILDKYNFQLSDIENTQLFERAFDQPFDNMDTAIPILYQSGYLTIKDYNFEENIYTLGIPNQEVHSGLYSTLMPRYLSRNLNRNESLLMAVKRA
ncbi:MAG: AAA family ATPase, partial [Muribaculaceae bacterium]|nr:AAA family ATPase [Muribaculaceae bacterium]